MRTHAKAVVGAAAAVVLAFLGALNVALNDGHVTANEWVDIAYGTVLAAAGVAGGVYAVPNARKRPMPGPGEEQR